MCQGIRTGVEVMVVLRFVNTHSPQNYGGMVPVTPDHATDIVNCQILPLLISNVLPARDFFQHQESQFIAGIKKMRRLRVVRSANNVAFQFLLENLSVPPLHPSRHGLTNDRKSLVTVETTKLDY